MEHSRKTSSHSKRRKKIIWIPGHSGIEGNKLADLQSKKGAPTPQDKQPEHSFACLEPQHTRHIQNDGKVWWDKYKTKSYSKLEIANAPSYLKQLHLSRKAMGRPISWRTGYGGFAPYHLCSGHTEAHLQSQFGSEKTQLHLFFGGILRRRGHRPEGSINHLTPKILQAPEGTITLTNWL